MNIWLLILLVPAFLVGDILLHLALRRSGVPDAAIDDARLKRVAVMIVALWAIDGWRGAEARYNDIVEAREESRTAYHVCMTSLGPRIARAEAELAAFQRLYGRFLLPQRDAQTTMVDAGD